MISSGLILPSEGRCHQLNFTAGGTREGSQIYHRLVGCSKYLRRQKAPLEGALNLTTMEGKEKEKMEAELYEGRMKPGLAGGYETGMSLVICLLFR